MTTSILNNPSTKKVYSYLGQNGQWTTLYKLNGEFITENSGNFSKVSREAAYSGIWFQMNRQSKSQPNELLIDIMLS